MGSKIEKIFNISGRNVLITGACGYFGRYIAKTFLQVGANVVLMSRSDLLSDHVKTYNKEFGQERSHGFQVDFYDRKLLEEKLKEISSTIDIDVVINNACDLSMKTGFNTPSGHFETSSFEQWQAAYESGVYWAVLISQVIGEQFKKKKRGSIINVSSMYGAVSPSPKLYEGTVFFNPPSYSVNKAAILALTRYIASFWGPYGIRCNAILPGPFPNVESKSSNSVDSDDFFIEQLKEKTVLNKVGHPDDLRGLLIYLACDASSYMTGQAISIDGGWTIV